MIEIILGDHQHFHSDWQCDYAITVRAGGTLYGCYKQAVREIYKRWRGLRDLYSQRGQSDEPEPIEFFSVLRDTEREFLRFYGQAIAIRRALGLGDSESMPDEMRERLDVEMWQFRIRSMAAVDFITAGRLQRGTVELLQACPPEMRQSLAEEILDPAEHDRLIQWYLTFDPQIPNPLAIPQQEAVALLSQFKSKNGSDSLPNYVPAGRLSTPQRLPSGYDTASHAEAEMGCGA